MKQFKANELSVEEQLGLRLYNLEITFGAQDTVNYLMAAAQSNKFAAFDDPDYLPLMGDKKHVLYLHAVQIVKYFGNELTIRMLSFNFKEEVETLNAEKVG